MKLIDRSTLKNLLGGTFTLEKSDGTQYTIQAEVQGITLEDLKYGSYGVWESVNLRAFFLPYYTINGETITVEEDDYLYVDSKKYRIVRLIQHMFRGEEVYREAFLALEV